MKSTKASVVTCTPALYSSGVGALYERREVSSVLDIKASDARLLHVDLRTCNANAHERGEYHQNQPLGIVYREKKPPNA